MASNHWPDKQSLVLLRVRKYALAIAESLMRQSPDKKRNVRHEIQRGDCKWRGLTIWHPDKNACMNPSSFATIY